MANDLIDFLRARLNEERRAAEHEAEHPGGFLDVDPLGMQFKPPRVLAEIAAKQRIIDMHADATEKARYWSAHGESKFAFAAGIASDYVSEVLRQLALPYDWHPDYDESWRP